MGLLLSPFLLQPLIFCSLSFSLSVSLGLCSFLSLLPCLSLPESFAERRWPSPSGSKSAAGDGGAGNSRVEERDVEIYDIEND